jgi:uncharacterized protein (TIGR00251 family)
VIVLTDHAEGIVLPVRVQPKARRPGVMGEQNGALKIAVSAPPEDGKANRAAADTLADALGVRRGQVELLSGATSRDKVFLIRGLSKPELQSRLSALLSD